MSSGTVAKGPVGEQVPSELRKQPEGALQDLRHSHDGLENQPYHTV
jgi:hypothetical protein